jgi:STE24 endopeptidase
MSAIHPLLDREKQVRARRYEREKRWLGLAGTVLSLGLLLGFYYSGLSPWAARLFQNESFVPAFFAYGFFFLAALTLGGLPLSFYSGYIHEHRWGFSNHTVGSWLREQGKSFLISLLLLYVVLGLLLGTMELFGRMWWIVASAAMVLVSVVFATIFPILILPIFNTYTPIEDEALVAALEETLSRGGLKSSGFFQEDMSRQTKKENAFLAGLGKTRRVVLGDNLINNMNVDEISSVIAHEVGHYRHRHMWKNIVIGSLQQIIVFGALHAIALRLLPGFLDSPRSNLALLPWLVVLAGVVSGFLFGPLGKALSRHFERKADAYALDSTSNAQAFLTAMAGLADRNLANAYPSLWVKLLYYSHPPIGERLQTAEDFKDR